MSTNLYYTSFFGIRLLEELSEDLIEKYEGWSGQRNRSGESVMLINTTPMDNPTYYAVLEDTFCEAEVYEVDEVMSHPDKSLDDWFPLIRFLNNNNLYSKREEGEKFPPMCWHSGIIIS